MRRDFLTPAIVVGGIVIVILALWIVIADGQTSKTPIKNGILQSDLDAAGFKILRANMADYAGLNMTWNPVTGRFDGASGGAGAVSSVFTRTGAVVALVGDYSAFYQPLDSDLTTWAGLTPSANFQTMVPHTFAQMKTDLGLVIGTNVQAWDTDLDVWATKTPYAGTVTITTGKTFNATNNLTLSGTDGSTLNVGAGGTLGTAAYTASGAYEVPLTFSTGLTRSTNTVTVNTSQNIATLSNLTTNGFVKTGGAVGTLSVDTATYQASNANLTSWAAITRASGIDTFVTTPSSANLRSALTDENGTGAALFSGATTPDFTTGFTIGAAAASGKIPIGDGTKYGPSTPVYPTTVGTAGYTLRSDGTTGYAAYPQDMFNSSVTSQATFSTSDIYITNSNVTVAAGDFKAKGQYRCLFDMTKSAGTGAIVISLRVGTLGAIGDAAILTFTFTAGTSVADAGTFEVIATWRTVGSGTSAVMQGICRANKNTATAAGLWGVANDSQTIVATTSSGFNSSTATNVGVSFNGATAFAGTSTLCQATLIQ